MRIEEKKCLNLPRHKDPGNSEWRPGHRNVIRQSESANLQINRRLSHLLLPSGSLLKLLLHGLPFDIAGQGSGFTPYSQTELTYRHPFNQEMFLKILPFKGCPVVNNR